MKDNVVYTMTEIPMGSKNTRRHKRTEILEKHGLSRKVRAFFFTE